ncbi:MAG TPA: ISL3 family transposase [Gemmatimonadetes bacterium]|nr:ISL3 family transposase [Gemmatimonadota bacterium]
MQLKTILNRRYPLKRFVYGKAEISGNRVLIDVRPRKNSKPCCGQCGSSGPTYDTRSPREFQFVPILGLAVFFVYAMRRVDCSHCGVKTEYLEWSSGKERMTTAYKWFLSSWARRMSWSETARIFGTSWNRVYRSVRHAVMWGLVHREEPKFTAIGIDEIAARRGHRYLTLVYQIDEGSRRLLWVGRERKEKTLEGFFDLFETSVKEHLRFVCSDMWKPYLNVIANRAGHALNILDRYHVMATMNKKVDKVRAEETRQMQRDGYEPILKHSRWCLLKRPKNRTKKQTAKMRELMKYNLRTMRAYLMKEDFQQFWSYQSPTWAGKFLDSWCTRAMRSQLDPMKEMAATLRRHRELLLNWFAAKGELSSGSVEGMNTKAKVALRKSYGFKTDEVYETVLYHELGRLPQHELAHQFC